MESIKKLFKAESEDESIPLLSEILKQTGGYLLPEKRQVLFDVAKELQAKAGMKSEEEEEWLLDFITNIDAVFASDRVLDEKVAERTSTQVRSPNVNPIGPPNASQSEAVVPRTGVSSFRSPSRIDADRSPHQTTSTAAEVWGQRPSSEDRLPRPLPPLPNQAIKLNELVHKPEKFDGKREKAYRWVEDYDAAAIANGWTDFLKVKYISAFFEKSARDWYSAMLLPTIRPTTTWSEVRRRFIRYYIGPEELDAVREELRQTKQRFDEPVTDFISRVMRLLRMAHPEEAEAWQVKEVKSKLRNAYQDRLIGQRPATLEELTDLCLEIEDRFQRTKNIEPNSKTQPRNDKPKREQDKQINQNDNRSRNRNRQKREGESSKPKEKRECTFCKGTTHTVEYCWAKNGKPTKKKTTTTAAVDTQAKSTSSSVGKVVTMKNVCSVIAMTKEMERKYPMIPVKLNGRKFKAMVDCGSSLSFIRPEIANKLKIKADGKQVDIGGADGQPLANDGRVILQVQLAIGDTTKAVEFYFVVMPNLCVEVLFGNDLSGLLKLEVSLHNRQVRFGQAGKGARLRHDIIVPPRSQMIVEASVSSSLDEGTEVATTPYNTGHSLMVANVVATVGDQANICCAVANLEPSPLKILAGMQIAGIARLEPGKLVEKDEVAVVMPLDDESGEPVKMGDDLTDRQRGDILRLLRKRKEALSINGAIGETQLVQHDIELEPGTQPVVEPLRRRPQAHRVEAERQVKQLLEDKVIEPSSSPWSSAYVLVKKKTGDMRLCIDFRKLNEKTKKNVYPLPNIEDCLEPLSGNTYFSQLDLASGYWQIGMAERAKELTAFRTESGHWQWRKMPFGLTNAPASFSRLMNALFGGLRGVHLQVFIDDICLASNSWSEHLELIDKVLCILIEANLKLKVSKCSFGCSKVIFLGHEISRDGIRPDPAKLRAIKDMPEPTNVKEVRSVGGFFNYYRRFVPNYAIIAEPLSRLTRKNCAFEWGNEQKAALQKLKDELVKNPRLTHFDHNKPLALKTDACRIGVAGLLVQQESDGWQPVTCCSRRISATEERYGITDLEALAIVYSCTKLRNYLLGKPFLILTDHCALCAIKRKVPHSPRLYRWALLLSEFDFTIKYIRGGLHSDVDCLSRSPVDDADDHLSSRLLAISARDTAEWARLTEEDGEGKEHFIKARARVKGYKIFNGQLYFEERLFVPDVYRQDILSEAHCGGLGGHGGVRATTERLAKLWWPNMASDVQRFVRSCHICQARKAERTAPKGEMRSFVTHQPFELVACDALGALPPSVSGAIHVMVAIDCFTRYVIAEAVNDVKAGTFANFLSNLISRFGVPKAICTDNAPTNTGREVQDVLETFNIHHNFSTPGHHRGNAMVERVIQTLQEKLSLLTHDPMSTADWHQALPNVVLSINTSISATTGFSPFELLFGRKHHICSEYVSESTSAEATFVEMRDARAEIARKAAIARQKDVQSAAKEKFDATHKVCDFRVGQLVLARLMGRRTKLQNRYQGPYRITKREADICSLERVEGRRELLERHVNDLKEYVPREAEHSSTSDSSVHTNIICLITTKSTIVRKGKHSIHVRRRIPDQRVEKWNSSSCVQEQVFRRTKVFLSPEDLSIRARPNNATKLTIVRYGRVLFINTKSSINKSVDQEQHQMKYSHLLCLLLITVPNPSYPWEFEEAPLVSWTATKYYVTPGPITFRLAIKLGNPCAVLRQFRIGSNQVNEIEGAVAMCQTVFAEQVTQALNQWSIQQDGVSKTYAMVPVVANVQHGAEQLQGVNPVVLQQSQPKVGGQPMQVQQHNGPSKQQHATHFSNKLELAPLVREKRLVAELVVGTFAGNVLTTILDRLWKPDRVEQELLEADKTMEAQLRNLNRRQNFTELQIMSLREAGHLTAQLVEHNIAQISVVRSIYPPLAVVAGHIMAKTHLLGANLERVWASFKLKKLDLAALHSIFKFDPILEVDSDSIFTNSMKLSSPSLDTLQVEFTARRKSTDTKVYQVNAFRYWTEGDGRPVLKEYAGPRFVIHNQQTNCAQGVAQPSSSFVSGECSEQNHYDQRLSNWRTLAKKEDIQEMEHQTEVIEAWPQVFVYCYPQTITLRKEALQCPSFPFVMEATERWSTSSFNYSPTAVELNTVENWPLIRKVLSSIHLKDQPGIMPKAKAFRKLNELYEKVGTYHNQSKALTQQLEAAEGKLIAFAAGGHVFSWKEATIVTSGVLILMALLVGWLDCYHRSLRRAYRDMIVRREARLRENRRSLLETYASALPRPNQRQGSVPMIAWQRTENG